MSTFQLSSFAPVRNAAYYLDTSALFALAHRQGKSLGVPKELKRAERIVTFAANAKAAQATLVTSVLAFEEVAAATRNNARKDAAGKAGFNSWKDFKDSKPSDAATADADAHARMMKFLEIAATGAGELGVECVWPPFDKDHQKAGRILRKRHRQLLTKQPEVDAMDALHIVLGLELGTQAFVTFDQAWSKVLGINILS